MRACPHCQGTVGDEAKFCGQCGRTVDGLGAPPTPPHPKWYYNVWFVLFMLFFVLGPFGLPLVWKNPRFSRWIKIGLTLAMVAYTVVLIDLTIRTSRAVMEQVKQFNATLQ